MECRPLLILLAICFFTDIANAQDESDETLLEVIYGTLTEIQLEVKKEDRFREVAQLLRIDAKLDEINRKINSISPSKEKDKLKTDAENIRTNDLETVIGDIQNSLLQINKKINKIEHEEKNNTQEINNKIQKLSNIIASVLDLNKNQQNHLEPSNPQDVERSGYGLDMTQFILENLEEIERKFKEGLRNLKDDVKRNLNFIKAIAAPFTSQCSKSNGKGLLDVAESVSRGQTFQISNNNQESMNAAFRNMENTLALAEKEIKEEIGSNIQSIDIKLSDISNYLHICERPEPSRRESETVGPRELRISPHTCSNASHIRIPKNCWELKLGGANCDGPYIIYPMGVKAVRVYCDMTNGGWTVILRRGEYGQLQHSFEQNWESYKMGFGDVNGEYWLGNENLYLLSRQDSLELQIDLIARDGASTSLLYTGFSVNSEISNYRLRLGSPVPGPTSTLATYFRHHSSHPFSTFDRNNRRGNCPSGPDRSGWWHLCHSRYVRLTEPHMTWYTWNPEVQYATMKVRPMAHP